MPEEAVGFLLPQSGEGWSGLDSAGSCKLEADSLFPIRISTLAPRLRKNSFAKRTVRKRGWTNPIS